MLRTLAIILVLANVAYMAWTHGWLYAMGLLPAPWPLTEPDRMTQQLRAEHIEIRREPKTPTPAPEPPPATPPLTTTEPPAESTATAGTPAPGDDPPATAPEAPAATACLQLNGALSERSFASLRAALTDALPDSAWTVSTSVQAARWIVYSGKLASAEALAARKVELRLMQVEFRDVSAPNLQPGLALGTYSTEASAQQALRDVAKAGVKNAKVVVERPEATLYTVKLPQATQAIQTRFKQVLDSLPPDAFKGKALQACA